MSDTNSLRIISRFPNFDNIAGNENILLTPNDQNLPDATPIFTTLGTLTINNNDNKCLIQGTIPYNVVFNNFPRTGLMLPLTVKIKVFNGTDTTNLTEIKILTSNVYEAILAPLGSGTFDITQAVSFNFVVDSNSSIYTGGNSIYTITTELHEYLFSGLFKPDVYLTKNYEIIATELAGHSPHICC